MEKARVVVGLDFGTTFSGFAFAHTSNPEEIYTYYDYPRTAGEKPYCKTLTASYYKPRSGGGGGWQLKSWGYPARAEYERDIQAVRKHRASSPSDASLQPTVGKYLTRFKLHLASSDLGTSSASPLPEGLTTEQVITDYLREMGGLILEHLQQKYGNHFTKEMIQWCITVPSIWDNSAKASMKSCMIGAGLLKGVGGSPHRLILVLEPEAASFHCHKVKVMCEQILEVGDKLLVADVGGGTSDIVVQEVVSIGKSYKVKEVTTSSGGLCGGTYVDSGFMEFLNRKVGPCLQECILTYPNVFSKLIKGWEYIKTSFGSLTTRGESMDIDFPNSLVTEWESYDQKMGMPARHSYDHFEVADEEMQSIFDPVVEKNLELISQQLRQAGGAVKVIVVVGGFAESPYLMNSIKRRFSKEAGQIISPPNPGSAVCQGAVALAFNPGTIVSRICKKTYGYLTYSHFEGVFDPVEYLEVVDGIYYCKDRFRILVRKGDRLKVDDCVSQLSCPLYRGQKSIEFRLFSSDETDPRYAVGKLVKEEGSFEIDISGDMELDKHREVKVSLSFGGSSLEVKAEAVNFMAQQVELPVEVDYLLK